MHPRIAHILEKVGQTCLRLSGNAGRRYRDIRSEEFWEIYERCKPFTMTSVERMFALYRAVNYVIRKQIPGDFIECGVWRGGSAMMIAGTLIKRGVTDRKIWLYDTFEGMSEPTTLDVDISGQSAASLMESNINNKELSVWCLAGIDEVRQNLASTGYPTDQIHFVPGKVEETLPTHAPPEPIALLRLDTDWYESTRIELKYLYPKLTTRGVLIIDDYGHWQGCRKAVDEFIEKHNPQIFLHRIDYTGRIGIKLGATG